MFLPGAKGSRLYESDTRRWEPVGNTDVAQLSLNVVGSSVSSNIRTRRHDVIQSAYELMDIYDDFVGDMYTLFDEAGIGDFEAVTYDWRLSLNEIVNKGAESNGYISYTTATNTPYIEQTLRRLAGNSPTGKATIVAHSNGGLVAKALMQKLGAAETAALIDKVIFVGVPQSGAPQAVGTLLYGYGEALPFDSCWTWLVIVRDLCSVLVDRPTARTFAENAPVSYHLLPSQAYFDAVQHDGVHPVVQFPALQAYSLERGAYGDVIGDVGELHHFLRASEGGRSKPNQADTQSANVLSAPLLAYAANTHAMLDAWIPPEGVDVYQIAGWGNDTVSGIEFYDEPRVFGLLPGRVPKYKPVFVEDGDGVVPVPSALMMAEDDNVKRYWVNLDEHDSLLAGGLDHAKIFRMDELRDFLTSIILDGVTELPQFITTSAPDPLSLQKKLRFILHSPLTLELSDEEGNRVGYAEDGSFDYEIPNVTYGEFGEVKYLIAPAGTKYTVSLQGQDFGEFSLDIQEVEQGEVVSQSTIAGVPATPNTFAFLTIENGIEDASPLFVDEGGDGVSDIELLFEQGEVVVHESQASTAPSSSSTSSTSSSISLIQPLLAHLPPLMIPNIPPVIAIVPDVQHQAEQDILMLDEREAKESVMAESERGDETHTPFLERLFKILYTLWEYVKQIPSFLFG